VTFLKSSVGLSNNEEKVCLTPGCVKAAATVLDMIDTEQDPCNDFYDFACGNFIKESVQFFKKNGYAIVPNFISEKKCQDAVQEIDNLI